MKKISEETLKTRYNRHAQYLLSVYMEKKSNKNTYIQLNLITLK